MLYDPCLGLFDSSIWCFGSGGRVDTWGGRQSTSVHNRLNGTNVGWRMGGRAVPLGEALSLLFREHRDKNQIV